MKNGNSLQFSTGRASGASRRWLRIGAAGLLALSTLALAGCGGGHAADNRNPQMQHGNFEPPGTRAIDTQGEAAKQQ